MSIDLTFSYHTNNTGIDYREAINNLAEYQEIASDNKKINLLIVNVPVEKLKIYETIFNHIRAGKRLVFKAGSIFRSKISYRGTDIEKDRNILHDFKHTVYPCISNDTPETLREQEIALLVLNERKELN
jgi:hypothetical protein